MAIAPDLEWVLHNPGLLRLDDQTAVQDALGLLQDIHCELPGRIDEPEKTPFRLGSYYEELINIIFNSSSYMSDIKRNITISENKITRGEFDFLGRFKHRPFHLECAIKFYLRTGPGDELQHFIGPGKADRLDIKVDRLFNHQLMLADTVAGQKLTRQLNLVPELRLLLLQGYLFHPWPDGRPDRLHPLINPNHLHGWWLHQHQADELLSDHRLRFVPMHKPHWLSVQPAEILDGIELNDWLMQLERPFLLSRGWVNGDDWQELDRGFVVPDDW